MPLPHRIAAGAIILREGKILLVRYAHSQGGCYLVAPGGAVQETEELADAAVRETREETGLTVAVTKPLVVENLVCSSYRMCKTWFLGNVIAGQVHDTQGARDEGITQAEWFSLDDLRAETVYPAILMRFDWSSFASPDWVVRWMGVRHMTF